MPSPTPRTLALRSGCRTAGGVVAFSRAFAAGEGPCDLLLALAEPVAGSDPGPAERVLLAVRQCLARAGGGSGPTGELVELLAAAHVWGRRAEPDARVRLTLVAVRESRFAAAQARSLPACLLREDTLRPLAADYPLQAPGDQGTDPTLEPELATGRLEDGDALLLGSNALHDRLGDASLRRLLMQTPTPDGAADRLVEDAVAAGGDGVAAAVVYVGVGPALLARLRPQPLPEPPLPPITYGAPPQPARGPWVAAAAALGGIALGIGVGVVLAVRLLAPGPAPRPLPTPMPASLPVPSAPLNPPAALPATAGPLGPPLDAGGSPPPTPPQPATGPAPAPAAEPVALPPSPAPEAPPSHTLAEGFGAGARLFLRADPARGLLLIQSSQGVLYGGAGGPGVPVGEALSLPLTALRGQPEGDLGQLRLYQGDHPAGSLSADDVRALLSGRPVTLPDLRPGDYQFRWWHPQSGAGELLYGLRLGLS